jgi:hypothetical protein
MSQHPTTRRDRRERSKNDHRAHTPEARAKREERRQQRAYFASGSGARSVYAYWLNDFIGERLPATPSAPIPARPYPLGRQYTRRFIAHIQDAHQGVRAGY